MARWLRDKGPLYAWEGGQIKVFPSILSLNFKRPSRQKCGGGRIPCPSPSFVPLRCCDVGCKTHRICMSMRPPPSGVISVDNRERTDGRAGGATTQLSLSSITRLRNAKARFNLSSFLRRRSLTPAQSMPVTSPLSSSSRGRTPWY